MLRSFIEKGDLIRTVTIWLCCKKPDELSKDSPPEAGGKSLTRAVLGHKQPWQQRLSCGAGSSGAWLPQCAGPGCIYEWMWRNSTMSPRCNCITPLLLHTHSTHWGTKSWMKQSSCQLRQRRLRKLSHSSFLLEAILSVVSLHTKCGLQQVKQGKIQQVLLLGSKTTGPKHYKEGDKWCMCCRNNVQMVSIQDRFPRFYTAAQQKHNSWAWWFFSDPGGQAGGRRNNPSTDICHIFKWRYFICHILWIQSSEQPDSTFARAQIQLFRLGSLFLSISGP